MVFREEESDEKKTVKLTFGEINTSSHEAVNCSIKEVQLPKSILKFKVLPIFTGHFHQKNLPAPLSILASIEV